MPSIPKELIDQFATGPMSAEAVNAAAIAVKKALIERALRVATPESASNHRNGVTGKTVVTDAGPVRIEVPQDRDGSVEPGLIPNHERRFTGFDGKIIALSAWGRLKRESGLPGRTIRGAVSPEPMSAVTDAVMGEVTAWQTWPLEPMSPVVCFGAWRVTTRAAGSATRPLTWRRAGYPRAPATSSGGGARPPKGPSLG